jgi:hypothetical protein
MEKHIHIERCLYKGSGVAERVGGGKREEIRKRWQEEEFNRHVLANI